MPTESGGKKNVRNFFKSLYAEPQVEQLPQADYDAAISRLIARLPGNTVVGDQALQSLLVNFVLTNAQTIEEVKGMRAALAGIKQRAVGEVIRAFPNADLDTIIGTAREAGYDVQVLKGE